MIASYFVKFMYLPLGLLVICLSGCVVDNTRQISMSHAAYNQTLIQNKQEELLLNLVRLRYRDTPFFLDTASVTATFKSESKVGLGAAIPFSGSVTGLDSSGSATLSVAPTVSYVPIEGDEYFKNFLTPISLDELLVMTQSGWGIDRIFGIAVEQINGLYNATAASGPTPANAPIKASQMEQVLQVLRRAQLNDSLNWAKDSQGQLYVYHRSSPGSSSETDDFFDLLHLDPSLKRYTVSPYQLVEKGKEHVFVKTRSILSILFYLSQNVEVGEEDLNKGWVTQTMDDEGKPYDWSLTPAGKRFKVYSSATRPEQAAIQVRYRDRYFFIKDHDLETKSTFMLLNHLYAFQSGTSLRQAPALTLPIGG